MISIGQRVRVHVNLHKGNLSVVDPKSGRVITNVSDITLSDVTFRHQPGCVDTILREGKRSVCAYAVGFVVAVETSPAVEGAREVAYNPFRRPDFHDRVTGETVTTRPLVAFRDKRAYAL